MASIRSSSRGGRGEVASHFEWAHCDPLQVVAELGLLGVLWLAALLGCGGGARRGPSSPASEQDLEAASRQPEPTSSTDVAGDDELAAEPLVEIPVVDREREYAACLAEARRLAEETPRAEPAASLPGIDPELTYFRVVHLEETV